MQKQILHIIISDPESIDISVFREKRIPFRMVRKCDKQNLFLYILAQAVIIE